MQKIEVVTFGQPQVNRLHREAVQDMQDSVSVKALTDAFLRVIDPANLDVTRETPERLRWWNFFCSVQVLPEAAFTVTYFRKCGQLRTMLARLLPGQAQHFGKYLTVWDIEAEGYRKINLDGIVKVNMETYAFINAPSQLST